MVADVHQVLAELVCRESPRRIVDLGAGRGRTLEAAGMRSSVAELVAIDRDAGALCGARERLPAATMIVADLARPLPLAAGAVDAVVSHNVLECLSDPAAVLAEIARVLGPGGRTVLGHVDFETITLVATDRELCRRVCRTYADLPVRYRAMATADAQMGRRLPGLVRASPLILDDVQGHVRVVPAFEGAAQARVREMARAVTAAAARGRGYVTAAEVDRWLADLRAVDEEGRFLFSETAYIVTAHRL